MYIFNSYLDGDVFMSKISRPQMKVIRFGREDVIATSGLPVYSMHVNDMPPYNSYIIMNGEGAKGFSDWYDWKSHSNYGSDTLTLVYFDDGDWYNDTDYIPGGTDLASPDIPEHRGLVYIWYGSGYGAGEVSFNTQGQTWGYYLDNGITLPRSN
jgi:hypothetical protein